MVKDIWKDPVWSKIISVGIIGLISLSYGKFLSITQQLTFKESLNKILEIQLPLIYVVVAIIAYWIISWACRKFFKKDEEFSSKKQKKLKEINNTLDPIMGLQAKWQVFFDYDIPFISNLTFFCTKHEGPPIRFMVDRCPIQGCENSKQQINKSALKNLIESDLIDRWDKLK